MNSPTFWSCSCESSAVTSSGARVQDPEPRHVRRAVAALHVLQGLRAPGPLAGVDLRLAEEKLGIVGALHPALLYPLLDQPQPLFPLPLLHLLPPDLHHPSPTSRRHP